MAAFLPLLLLALVVLWAPRGRAALPSKGPPQSIVHAPKAASPAPEPPARAGAERRASEAAPPVAEAPRAEGTAPAEASRVEATAPAEASRVEATAPAEAPRVEGTHLADGAEGTPSPDADSPAAGPGVAVERVSLGAGAFLLAPVGLKPEDGPYDLIVHFHGVTAPLERALGTSGLRAVIVDVTIGAGSGPYGTVVREGVVNLDRLIGKVERTMARRSRGFASVHVGRVALSAWSAGYGAVLTLLSSPRAAARVDAVLLADAPHAGLRDPRRREVVGAGLGPLLAFGRRALRGETLLAITHSDIATIEYASTHETADFIVRSLGLTRQQGRTPGIGHMVRTSIVEQGGFSVTGYEGVDARAHGEHLRNLDATLFPRLRRRWLGPTAERPEPSRSAGASPG
jgi:hypothetical protein